MRGKSVRRKIVALLLVPLVPLVSLWAFATYLTGSEAVQLLTVAEVEAEIGRPAQDAVRAVQRERRLALVRMADPRDDGHLAALDRQHPATDDAVRALEAGAADGDLRGRLAPDADDRLDGFLEQLGRLPALREEVDRRTVGAPEAFSDYNAVVDSAYAFLTALKRLDDSALEREGRAVAGLGLAREYLAREDTLFAWRLTAGTPGRPAARELSDAIAAREREYTRRLEDLPAEERRRYEDYFEGDQDVQYLRSREESVISTADLGPVRAVGASRWTETADAVLGDLDAMDAAARERHIQRVEPVALRVLLLAAGAGLLGLGAIAGSLWISGRVGRALVRDLRTLRDDATEAAEERLPDVMRRLADGETVDVEAEVPQRTYPRDETGQVGRALHTLRRAAVVSAVEQAELQRGVSAVFVNLARRNQVLLHRQLKLLDVMERRTEDADELADLFRLDHLTTRMRRHAEGLVILSGATPARQWRRPVRLVDVVRAAVAEVEDYERVEVHRLPRLAVDGAAVADLTHLIAELVENACVFSPPHTAVEIHTGSTDGTSEAEPGITLEIRDHGLGMPAGELDAANARLEESGPVSLTDTDRLGLFVVSRLARRHGVRVTLTPSAGGGTTAVVLLPADLLSEHTPGGTGEVPVLRRAPRTRRGEPAVHDGREEGAGRAPGGPRPPDVRAPARSGGHTDPSGDGTGLPRRRRAAPVLVPDHDRTPPGPDHTPAGAAPAGHAPEAPTTADGAPSVAPSDGAEPELPRRVRQASLAPQLKSGTQPDSRTPEPGTPGAVPAADAEAVRTRMTALAQGWRRARTTGEDGRPSPDRTAPHGNTTEGDGR